MNTDITKEQADELAEEIRRIDGNHSMGAGALAEALIPFILRERKEQAAEMRWEFEYQHVTVMDEPEATQLRLKIGHQSFNINDYCENMEHAEWMAKQLDIALRNIATPPSAKQIRNEAIESNAKDAERYRWLRDSFESGSMIRLLYEDGEVTPDFVDNAIDAAMSKVEQEKE